MSEEMKQELKEAIEQLKQLPPEKQSVCTGFVLGMNAAASMSKNAGAEAGGK